MNESHTARQASAESTRGTAHFTRALAAFPRGLSASRQPWAADASYADCVVRSPIRLGVRAQRRQMYTVDLVLIVAPRSRPLEPCGRPLSTPRARPRSERPHESPSCT